MKSILVATLLISSISFASAEKGHRDNTALFPPKQPNTALTTVPAATKLEAPAFMAKISEPAVTLKWAAVEGIGHYHVQVATDPNFKWLKVDEKLFTTNSIEVKDLEKGKHYYWRVAAVKPENDASYIKGAFAKSMFETPAQ